MPQTKVNSLGIAAGTIPTGAVSWTSNIVTSALTVSAGVGYFVNTSSAAITATLPASPTVGQTISFTDYNRTWATNALTLNTNSNNFQGGTSNVVYNTNGQSITITYADSTKGWIPTVEDDVTNTQSYSIDFLVVAGGGSGGQAYGAGGGAGGFRTSTQSATIGNVITVTVGDGGAASSPVTYGTFVGNSGNNSSISGAGLTTITSAGGGGGGGSGPGASGGSGGGGADAGPSGGNPGGSGNTPSTSPSQGNNGAPGIGSPGGPNYGSGGGGGAGAVGGNGTTTSGGNGGAGTANSITGSSITYAGGGGGGTYNGGTVGTGGSGGGGNAGTSNGGAGNAGTANLGGGGGGVSVTAGGYGIYSNGAGGKGVVILSMLTSKYTGTTTGSPTVTTSGSNTIIKFTGSGSYTT